MTFPLLSTLIFLPAGAALVVSMCGNDQRAHIVRWFSLFISIILLGLTSYLYAGFDNSQAGMQFVEQYPWIPMMRIQYALGVDGIAMPLLLLTAYTHLLVVLAAWPLIREKVGTYYAVFFLIQASINGVFCATDAILYFLFWEAMLIPMYLCIGVWGSENRSYAAMKFFLYTFLGSTLLLISILYLGLEARSFMITDFYPIKLTLQTQLLIFFAFFLSFGVKVPMWPVHTWLPDAHTQAPAGGSVILAALMLKVGAYGFFRFGLPILPDANAYMAPYMIALSLLAIVYIGAVALAQTDMKRLIAYSSVAHMGFVTLGLFAIYSLTSMTDGRGHAQLVLEGAMVQMIAHAFGSGAMFLAFGMIYDKYHTRAISDFGGIAQKIPYFTAFFVVFAFANVGLPGTSGFVGEFMVILGVYKISFWLSFCAALTLIIAAAYTLWMVKRVFYGPLNADLPEVGDVSVFEKGVLWLLVLAIFAIGLYPNALVNPMHASINHLLTTSVTSKLLV